METLIHYYYQQGKKKHFIQDQYQLAVVEQLQTIGEEFLTEQTKRRGLIKYFRKKKIVKGLYLWGSVGVGKTFLIDCFYNWLPTTLKMRMHFNAFMRFIHQTLKEKQGKKNPLQIIAKELAIKVSIICFDELFVTEIVDAILLAGLFKALTDEGVTLIFTSNTAPDNLYKRGLLRERFLPAITLIKTVTTVYHLDNHIDYRLRHLQEAGVFFLTSD